MTAAEQPPDFGNALYPIAAHHIRMEIDRLRAERDEARGEEEKWRDAARVLCGAHVGQPQDRCPVCERDALRERLAAPLPEDVQAIVEGLRAATPFQTDVDEEAAALIERMARRNAELEAERDEARRFGEDAAARYNELIARGPLISCAYCGFQYPPDVPSSQHEALTAHVRVCEKHPMRALESEHAALRADFDEHARCAEDCGRYWTTYGVTHDSGKDKCSCGAVAARERWKGGA